mmetsp:Transcript_173417/g.421788  ORF Transcript_173417/g.421788 Transcript_173417/m.421788 type:complete len:226 (+) Transcript_173417:275-952(+)
MQIGNVLSVLPRLGLRHGQQPAPPWCGRLLGRTHKRARALRQLGAQLGEPCKEGLLEVLCRRPSFAEENEPRLNAVQHSHCNAGHLQLKLHCDDVRNLAGHSASLCLGCGSSHCKHTCDLDVLLQVWERCKERARKGLTDLGHHEKGRVQTSDCDGTEHTGAPRLMVPGCHGLSRPDHTPLLFTAGCWSPGHVLNFHAYCRSAAQSAGNRGGEMRDSCREPVRVC